MTVSSSTARSGPYLANGVTTSFARTFLAFDADHVKVYQTISGSRSEVTTGFSHTGINSDSGSVDFSVAPVSGSTIEIVRAVPREQNSDYSSQGSVSPEVIERDFDLQQMQLQDMASDWASAVRLAGHDDLEPLPATPSNLIGINASGELALFPTDTAVLDSRVRISFDTRAGAQAAGINTGSEQYIYVADILYEYDAAGTALTTGDGRKWKAAGQPSIEAFGGGVSESSASNTAAIALLENAHPGADIDLGGRTYEVTSIPEHIAAFHGAWLVAGEIYPVPHERMTAFGNTALTVADYPRTYWEAGLVFEQTASGGVLHSFQYFTQGHAAPAAHLQHSYSEDGGLSVRRGATIFNPGGGKKIIGAAITRMDNDRVGGIVGVLDGDDFAAGPFEYWFVYSDDLIGSDLADSPTWTAVDITTDIATSADHRQPYGMMMRGPSGASGDWQVGAYGDSTAWIIRTTNNGTNWTSATLKDGTGITGGNPQEASIVETPDGWVAFARTSTNDDLHVSTSTDGLTWTDWTDTNVPLGGNPVHAIYDGGKIQVLLTWRYSFSGTEAMSGASVFKTDYATCVASPTDLAKAPRTRIADLGNRSIGYFQSVRMPRTGDDLGFWVHFGKASESTSTVRGASSSRVRLSQVPAAMRRDHPAAVQVIDNPGFALQRIGGSPWTGVGAGELLADRWRAWAESGVTFNVTHAALTNEQREYFPFLTHGLTLTQSAPATTDNHGLQQRHLGRDARRLVGLMDGAGRLTVRVYGFGHCPKMRADLLVNGNALATDSTVGAVFAASSTMNAWRAEFVMSAEMLRDMGTPPADWSSITSVDFLLRTAGAGEQFNSTTIAGVFFWFGGPAPYEREIQSLEPNEHYMWSRETTSSNMRIATGVAVSNTLARFTIATSDLFTTPTVSATLANVKIETAGGDLTATSLTAVYATGFEPGVLVFDVGESTASLTPGEAVTLKLTSGTSLIASTGF